MTEANGLPPFQRPLEEIGADERPAAVVNMLFVAREPTPLGMLRQQLGCTASEVQAVLVVVAERVAALGLQLQWCDEEQVQLVTSPRYATLLQRFLGLERTVRLSQAALETLAIVAYRQPITRTELEAIRGVDSSGVLQTLLARELVEPIGRLPTVGNPVQYGTTSEFLRFFGLGSLSELPPIPGEASPAESSTGPAEAGQPATEEPTVTALPDHSV